MKHINIPQGRMIALVDDFQGLVVSGGNKCPAGFALMEELFLGHFASFGMMCNEDNLDILIAGAEELIQKKKEAPREILLHGVHRAGSVHDAENDGIGFVARIRDRVMVAQIVDVERKPVRRRGADMMLDGRLLALDPRACRALFIQAHTNSFAAEPLMPELPLDFDLTQALALNVR